MWSTSKHSQQRVDWFGERISSNVVQPVRSKAGGQNQIPRNRPTQNGWYEVQRYRAKR